MHFHSRKLHLLILGVTSLACSRLFFFLLDDPEGPNLLIVTGLAFILYLPSLAMYAALGFANPKKLLSVVLLQLVVVTSLYFGLK